MSLAWARLSQRAQVRRLGQLARRAVEAYALGEVRVRPVNHGENATFRVQAPAGQFLLRVHRHGYHSPSAIACELSWLDHCRSRGLAVPAPMRSAEGERVLRVAHPAVPDPRSVTLLSWETGALRYRSLRPLHARRLGALIAALHGAAEAWSAPLARPVLDLDGSLYGGFGRIDRVDWLDADQRALVADTERALRQELAALPAEPQMLVHADLHLGNVLFGPHPIAIDWDDSGLGTPSLDLAIPLSSLGHRESRPGDPRPGLRDALLDGYSARRELPGQFERRRALWHVVRELTVLAWVADRAELPEVRANRPEVTARVLDRCRAWLAE